MSIGFWQIAIVVLLLVVLFGRGKISELMGDVARGIKSFKSGLPADAIVAQPHPAGLDSKADAVANGDETAKSQDRAVARLRSRKAG